MVMMTMYQYDKGKGENFFPWMCALKRVVWMMGVGVMRLCGMTKVLEESGELPGNIQHFLLVGGGSKFRLFELALQDAISALMGPSSSSKVVIPEASLRAELTTMGAAALLPNYDYNYKNGLERLPVL